MKKFLLKLALADAIILLIGLGLGMALIVPDCFGGECAIRGELLGQGLGQFIIFSNLLAGFIYYLKNKKK